AVRRRRRERAHARGSGSELRRHARTHPPDRSEGAAQAAASVAEPQAARISGRSNDVTRCRVPGCGGPTVHTGTVAPGTLAPYALSRTLDRAHSSTVRAAGS